MSMFTLAISCLTTFNLPWFMELTFQVPIQYCSLYHWTLLPSPVPFTAGCCFCFGSIPSFFLELFLHWSPVAYWATTDLGSSYFSGVHISVSYLFAFSYCSWGSQGKNTEWFDIPSSSGPHSVSNKREDSTHGHHQMVNTEIRLIIFFAAKDGEALYSQQKQDQELTVAQIINSLLPNSDWNWRKWRKWLDHSGMTWIKSLMTIQWKWEIDLRA